MEIFIKLKNMDRRYLYIILSLAVILPLFIPIDFPLIPGANVKNIHNFIEDLPAGSKVFLSFDFDLASDPELGPSATAIITHLFRKNIAPVCGGNWPLGGDMASEAIERAVKIYEDSYDDYSKKDLLPPGAPPKLESGVHFINLGYRPGAIIHIKSMISDFMETYAVDVDGNPTADMPVFQKTDGTKFNITDISLIISFTAGTGGIEEFIAACGEHKRPMAAGCTSVNIPRFITYMQTKQLIGMTGGLPGAAEYETLVGFVGPGRVGMASQSFAHLVIMLFIIFGNIAFIVEKKNAEKNSH